MESGDTDTRLKIGNLHLNIEYSKTYLKQPLKRETEYRFSEPIFV